MTLDYLLVRGVHETTVALSVAGFALRAGAGLAGARWVRARLARTLPHVVDSVLLASALVLVALLQVNPLATPWLLAKLGGLLAYIGLGVAALRPSLPRAARAAALLGALAVVGWIVSVAFTKSPLGFVGLV